MHVLMDIIVMTAASFHRAKKDHTLVQAARDYLVD